MLFLPTLCQSSSEVAFLGLSIPCSLYALSVFSAKQALHSQVYLFLSLGGRFLNVVPQYKHLVARVSGIVSFSTNLASLTDLFKKDMASSFCSSVGRVPHWLYVNFIPCRGHSLVPQYTYIDSATLFGVFPQKGHFGMTAFTVPCFSFFILVPHLFLVVP